MANKTIREVPYDRIPRIILRLLKSYFWLPSLEEWKRYTRKPDIPREGASLTVFFSPDGDAHLSTVDENGKECVLTFHVETARGEGCHTRRALLVLAEAIRLDNEEKHSGRH